MNGLMLRLTIRLHLSAFSKQQASTSIDSELHRVTSDREDRSINLQYERSTTAQVAQL